MFTAHGRLALLDELPAPPARDTAHFGALPDTMPLIVQHAPGIPYLAVHVHYGDRHSTDATGTVRIEAEAGTWPLTEVTPGHRLDEEIPVAAWPRAAGEVGRELEGHARRIDVETVVDFEEQARIGLARAIVNAIGLDRPVRVTACVMEGNPARVLLDAAQGADLLVVGNRGARRLHRGAAGIGRPALCPALTVSRRCHPRRQGPVNRSAVRTSPSSRSSSPCTQCPRPCRFRQPARQGAGPADHQPADARR
ncbi:hypothetical protein ABT115_11385 [Streptomyces sp. NPDC001832]|uniref:hypothetical protein n=1 Tax=Streptomyces sp. NPDC001832 TaxID=3154527 RepID=UPI00332BB3C3